MIPAPVFIPELSRNDQEEISPSDVYTDSRPTVSPPTEINVDISGDGRGQREKGMRTGSSQSQYALQNLAEAALTICIAGYTVGAYMRMHSAPTCLRIYMNL